MKDYNINVSNKGLNIMVNSRTNKIIIPVMLISDTYHYSFDKIMNVLGLGMLNIIKLQSD